MYKNKEKLYRKVNTRTHHHEHHVGGDARHSRNTKSGISTSMKKNVERGLDYTPLYRFLLSKIGQNWDEVFSEAKSRLDKVEPIYYIVALDKELDNKDFSRISESSYYSRLIVDDNNLLQLKNPNLKNEDMKPLCPCCTHTFNGKPFVNKYIKSPIQVIKYKESYKDAI